MSVGVAPGYPQLSGSFIPEVWSSQLNYKFYAATCLSEVANTDWEGEITGMGDKVKIRQIPTITIRDYVKGQELVHETPTVDPITLNIDKAKYWDFVVDDIDKVQSDIDLFDSWTTDASLQMKIAIERQVFSTIYADADTTNQGATAGADSADINLGATGSPVAITKSNAVEFSQDMTTCWDENNVPEENRNYIYPPWMCTRLRQSDLKSAFLTGDETSPIRNGRVGLLDGNKTYRSNLLTTGTDTTKVWHTLGIQKNGLTFAGQITQTEKIRSERTMGWIVRGLMVYGYMVNKPTSIVHGYVKKG